MSRLASVSALSLIVSALVWLGWPSTGKADPQLRKQLDVHGNFVRPKSALESFQLLSLVDTEVVAVPSLRARRLDRVTMEEFVGAGAPRPFFVHCTAPVGSPRASREDDNAGERFTFPPRYRHGASLPHPLCHCRKLVLWLAALRTPAHQR